jgi:hypothetical protein
MTTPFTPRKYWPYAFTFVLALHVAAVLALAIAIATGHGEMRFVLAFGITVVASAAWSRLLWQTRTEYA